MEKSKSKKTSIKFLGTLRFAIRSVLVTTMATVIFTGPWASTLDIR